MNASDMLDYSLGQLEGPRLEQVEREVAADPALSTKIDRISRNLAVMLDDGLDEEEEDLPDGLADRTLKLVAEQRRRRQRTVRDLLPVRVPFRWADVAVAAGIFLAGVLTLLPAVQRSRLNWNNAACAANLQQIGLALNRYALLHNFYPYTPPDSAAPFAGTFALQLNDAGLLPELGILECPCHGRGHLPFPFPTHAKLCETKSAQEAPCLRAISYAYNLGFEREGSPAPIPFGHSDHLPLLADKPPYADSVIILDGNSPNHGGRGQNVLFAGGHVGWHANRKLGGDPDMFLNQRRQPAPGVNDLDAVLAPGPARFDGK